MTDAAIEARGLRKIYKNVRAVDSVSFKVRKGEIYGFLGPNGAGKTTTMKMVLGLAQPTAGQALLGGVDVATDPVAARRGLGFLPESLNFYKTLTGRQTLRFFGELKGVSRSEVDERLAQVGLEQAADRRVGGYSKGMTQRLGLAQALLGSPSILVLDEPSSGLDPAGARQVRDILRWVNQRGTTILFSSHILSEVQEVANRVLIINKGRVVAEDTMGALRDTLKLDGRILVRVAPGEGERAAGALRALGPGVAVEVRGDLVDARLQPKAKLDALNAIARAGVTIQDFETKDSSLEDVFIKMTSEPAAPAPREGIA
ncbi:MAG TPA: ABC transporter ATP-binding protein [Candidatus Thermoplasmatota archaeon]|nr:ABC transporter ATP-binding protein [Candidatus Thermoplasmatota archaeon]